MKSTIFLIAFFLSQALLIRYSSATTISATSSGDWNAAGTWSLNRLPTCGDTVMIPFGKSVTVTAQENLVPCVNPVIVYVSGTWQFTNGNKIDFPCGSWVYISSTGIVKKVTSGGGNSTLISICGYIEWKAGDGNLLGIDTLGGNGSLPVTWLSIQACMKRGAAVVDWSTGVEINNDYFKVMKSDDGENWTEEGRITGNGNCTNVSYYTFTDKQPAVGVNYYRIIQVDYDGTQGFSDIVAVFNPNGNFDINEVSLSPNPITSVASVIFNCAKDCNAKIEIKNAQGQLCLIQPVTASKGINTVPIDQVGRLSNGVYSLCVTTESGSSRPFGLLKK